MTLAQIRADVRSRQPADTRLFPELLLPGAVGSPLLQLRLNHARPAPQLNCPRRLPRLHFTTCQAGAPHEGEASMPPRAES